MIKQLSDESCFLYISSVTIGGVHVLKKLW